MPKEMDFDCADGRCTWRWNANAYPVDEITVRVRHEDGTSDVMEVPNTGELVLPDHEEVEEIVSTGRGGQARRRRWRGPG